MPGEESLVLRSRLANEFALTLHAFRYSAVFTGMSSITASLADFVRELARFNELFGGH